MIQQCSLSRYASLVFDCDGVVLDSNKVKTKAFYQATRPYGEGAAKAMVAYHVANGGISRYKKFAHFLEKIVPEYALGYEGPDLDSLLEAYAGYVREGLLNCDIAPGLKTLRQQTRDARWLIVSGGDQAELRDLFAQRGIAEWFDGGIFGSPDGKDEILFREREHSNIGDPALFLGDSKYDYQVASAAGLDFVFINGWSEVADWQSWVNELGLIHVPALKSLL